MDVRSEEKQEGKSPRIPFGGLRLKTQLSQPEQVRFVERGMVPHWFNDQDGRIERATSAGYTFVDPKYARSLGASALGQGNSDLSKKVSKIVTKGNELVMRAYLMEIPKKYYDEDQAAKELVNDKVDTALALGGKGGADVENFYVPE